jgi:hypothetical protein
MGYVVANCVLSEGKSLGKQWMQDNGNNKNDFLFFSLHLFIYAYIVWAISPPYPHPHHLPLSLILLKKDISIRKTKHFLLVEIRIAIQRNS